jgi:hypothetical protein
MKKNKIAVKKSAKCATKNYPKTKRGVFGGLLFGY